MDKKLEIFQKNIINWYAFNQKESLLLIGDNVMLKQQIEQQIEYVISVKNVEEVERLLENQNCFDYILIYGYEKCPFDLALFNKLLKPKGRFLIIGENDTGICHWAKYQLEGEMGVRRLEKDSITQFRGLGEIKKELVKIGMTNTNTFYVFPHYQIPELIINEKFAIKKEQIEKYTPNISENEIKVFDEIKVLKKMVDKSPELLAFFTNSYFLEASREEIQTKTRYVSFNNYRKKKYQLLTIIEEDIVKKLPANEEAKQHIEEMKKNITDLKEQGVCILDSEKDGIIYSQLIKNTKTLDCILASKSNDLEEVANILRQLEEILQKQAVSFEEIKEELSYSKEERLILENMHFLRKGFWDMVPKNCFYLNGQYCFFDQEWEKDNLSVEFILYRSIINSYGLVRKIKVQELFAKLGILPYQEYFETLDKKLREEIMDPDIYATMYEKNIKGIDNLIHERQSYEQDNQKKEEYIKQLEKIVIELRQDNQRKQDYITELEKTKKKGFLKEKK